MANVLNFVLKNSIMFSSRRILCQQNISKLLNLHARNLYSPVTLGLENYIQQRERTKTQLSNISDKFKSKMLDYTSDDSKNMIFTEDLKNIIHLAEEDDLSLVINMMNRFNEQNKQLRFGNFVFGPVVMRLFHYLNRPKEALECFNSPKLGGFFDQLMSYQLLLDLLYENKMYLEVLKTFEGLQARQIEGIKFPKNIVVLTFAACYKLNTKESLDFALNLWKNLQNVGHAPMRRAVTFCAGLALNQGQPEAALEIASSTKNQNYTTVRNLKVAALTSVGRLDDIIPILKGILNQETTQKHTFNRDVLDKIENVVKEQGNTEIQSEFKKIKEFFEEHGHVSDATLDEQLCVEISPPPIIRKHDDQPQMRFNRFQRNKRQEGVQRSGLYDIQ